MSDSAGYIVWGIIILIIVGVFYDYMMDWADEYDHNRCLKKIDITLPIVIVTEQKGKCQLLFGEGG